METGYESCPLNKHLVLAVDESENSNRALNYVIHLFGGLSNVRVTLLHIISIPPEDFFETGDDRRAWIAAQENKARNVLGDYRQRLAESGFDENSIGVRIKISEGASVADSIFAETRELGASTIVVGRRGRSKKEEFIMGSTSNRILHLPKQCAALWVVE